MTASNFAFNSAGSGAPPETQTRSEAKSVVPIFGWSSSAWYIVGTPGRAVALVRPIAASTWPASKRGSITMHAAVQHGPIEHAGIGEDMEQRQHAQDPVGRAGMGIDRP